jgi:hypothetical protein
VISCNPIQECVFYTAKQPCLALFSLSLSLSITPPFLLGNKQLWRGFFVFSTENGTVANVSVLSLQKKSKMG